MKYLRFTAILVGICLLGFMAFAENSKTNLNHSIAEETGNPTRAKNWLLVASASPSELDKEMWNVIKNSEDIKDFEYYLKEFPNGYYRKIVIFKIRKLGSKKEKPIKVIDKTTIFDELTGLWWQKNVPGVMTWRDARIYCRKLKLGGYKNWNLPKKNELTKLFGIRDRFPDYHGSVNDYYWSITTNKKSSKYAYGMFAHNGRIFSDGNKTNQYYVRCVRSKKDKN